MGANKHPKIYRVGIVGCGRIASTFDDDPLKKAVSSHAGAYQHIGRTKLIAAADIDADKLHAFGKKWQVDKLYKDYEEMLEKEHLDILSICTWTSTHDSIAINAAKGGVSAIFCEKPIAESLKKADKMIEVCAKNGVILAVNHSRRWDPLHQKVRTMLTDGVIGDVEQVTCYYTAGIANTGTHMFDLLRFLLGEDVTWVWATIKKNGTINDPNIDAYLFFSSGTTVVMQSLDVSNYLIFEIDIYGTRGRVRIINSGAKVKTWIIKDSDSYSGYKELFADRVFDNKDTQDSPLVLAVKDIVECLDSKKRPRCTGEDGRSALELICALHQSANLERKVVLPLKERGMKIISR